MSQSTPSSTTSSLSKSLLHRIISCIRHLHTNAKPGEWIHVHRPRGGGGGGPDPEPWIKFVMYAIIGLVAWWIINGIISFITAVVNTIIEVLSVVVPIFLGFLILLIIVSVCSRR